MPGLGASPTGLVSSPNPDPKIWKKVSFGAAALAHLAHARAASATGMGGVPNTAAYTQLATKLESLINACLQPNVLPDIAKRVGSSPHHNSNLLKIVSLFCIPDLGRSMCP